MTALPFMWADVSAIQLLFSVHPQPVYFARVYGCVYTEAVTSHRLVYPHVPLLSSLRQIDGNDLPALPDAFTVVPLFSLEALMFGCLSSHNTGNRKWDALRSSISNNSEMTPSTLQRFRKKDILRVVGDEAPATFVSGYCASQSLCQMIGHPDIPAAN